MGFRDSTFLDRAEEIATRVLELDPDSPHGYRLLGNVQYKRGEMHEAILSAQAARERDPHDPDTAMYLNYWYGDVGRIQEMGPLVRQLTEENPLEPTSWWASGWYELLTGRFNAAVAAFEKTLRMDPDSGIARLSCGQAMGFGGRHSEACDMLAPLDDQPPESFYPWLGRHLRAAINECDTEIPGDPPEAVRAFLRTDEFLSWITAGGFARLGLIDEALEWLERAVDLGFINYPFLADVDPFLAGIRGEPRFQDLLRRVGSEWENFEV